VALAIGGRYLNPWRACCKRNWQRRASRHGVLWVDADVLIEPAAPSVVDGVPIDMVGAVDEFSTRRDPRCATVTIELTDRKFDRSCAYRAAPPSDDDSKWLKLAGFIVRG
jgi:hypothetical protein